MIVTIGEDRWAAYGRGPLPAAGRAPLVVVIIAFIGWLIWAGSALHPQPACGCGPQIVFGPAQPGFDRIPGPTADALMQLPVHVTLAPAVGAPVGVYRSGWFGLVLYGPGSLFGVFRFTAARGPSGFGAKSVRALGSECDVCSDNRLIRLTRGISGAVLVGGNGPNGVTWLEHGLEMVVLGPASTFTDQRAIGAARTLARANS